MNFILLGNGIALFGAVLMAAIGLIKQRKHILAAQCVQFGIMGIANLILGGINGFVSALVSITRNLICLKWELTTPIKIGIISIQAVLALSIDRRGVIGILPGLSACICTWFLDTTDEIKLKMVIIIAQVCWLIYDRSILNDVSFAFDIITILANLVGIVLIVRQRKTV
ncbi:YgjV family protein [uncultured Oscillibacter sp.]|uniref:YgjV family protein n=1 Tax=uncultured Oscillibacter sp. TaxID=876091 RepID=UPI0025FC1F89|nr:YgjV family protein [uncultured Oscillibacter sp.]